MPYRPRGRDLRKEAAFERLGTRQPQCPYCAETDPTALTRTEEGIICAECEALQRGKKMTEDHHPAGRNNDPMLVSVPANDHRVLSDLQRDWPRPTLRNPDSSPLLAASALIRGWIDVLRLIIERIIGWVPAFLEWLDDQLRERIGDRWWDVLGWEEAQ